MRFEGKIAVVTGGGSGIGRATAVRLGAEGAAVVVVDRNQDGAIETAQLVEKAGGRTLVAPADVGLADEVDVVFERTLAEFGGLDILVNNAGILRLAPFVETTDEDWEQVLRTNLTSVFLCSRAAARRMIAQRRGGRIVSISSIHATVSEPHAAPYTATKGGIEAFSRTLASELAPHRITVNCVRPGAVWTGMGTPLFTPEVLAALEQRVPLGEVARPEWIAAGVLYLASDDACYSTGTILDIDGGFIMNGGLPGVIYR